MQAVQQQFDTSHENLVESCKRQLIEEGKLVFGDDGYRLTAKGREAVFKEFRRLNLEHRPAMSMMIEVYVLNQHEHSVW